MDPFLGDYNTENSKGVYVLMHYAYDLKVLCAFCYCYYYCKWVDYNLDYVFGF